MIKFSDEEEVFGEDCDFIRILQTKKKKISNNYRDKLIKINRV